MVDPTEPERVIRVPESIAQQIQHRIEGSGFASIDAFVGFVLARLLESRTDRQQPFSEEDEQRLRQRLRSLGYID